jgi:hypothetical protein
VVAVRVSPVSDCYAVTLADGTTAPLGSDTVPRILAVICCAKAALKPAEIATKMHAKRLKLIIVSQFFFSHCALTWGEKTIAPNNN